MQKDLFARAKKRNAIFKEKRLMPCEWTANSN